MTVSFPVKLLVAAPTPLSFKAYFGHPDILEEILLPDIRKKGWIDTSIFGAQIKRQKPRIGYRTNFLPNFTTVKNSKARFDAGFCDSLGFG